MPTIPYLSDINWLSALGPTMFWIGWGSLGLLLSVVMYGVYYFFTFPFKMHVMPLYGSGTDGRFAVDKKKWNKAKWNKHKTKWQLLWPLFKNNEVEPFDSEYIYPGKQVYAFDLNGILIPGRINIHMDEDELRSEVNPVPYNIRHWQSLKHKEHAAEFTEATWWDQNKAWVYMLIAVAICGVMCVVCVWMSYKYVTQIMGPVKGLASSINNLGVIK